MEEMDELERRQTAEIAQLESSIKQTIGQRQTLRKKLRKLYDQLAGTDEEALPIFVADYQRSIRACKIAIKQHTDMLHDSDMELLELQGRRMHTRYAIQRLYR
jgi:hypothetical protein